MKDFPLNNPLLTQEQYDQMYAESFANKEQFWSNIAKEQVTWFKDFTKVKNTNYEGDVSIKWFEDGELNVCYNCVDRHAEQRPDDTAIIWEGDDPSQSKTYTYKELQSEVSRFANVLKKLGVKKGDRVTIYLTMIPEVAFRDAGVYSYWCYSLGDFWWFCTRVNCRTYSRLPISICYYC